MSIPKYVEVENWIKDGIYSNHFKKGEKIPSEAELMQQFGYSRQTIRTALGNLERMALLRSVKGSGTFVAHENPLTAKKTLEIGLILNDLNSKGQYEIVSGIKSVLEKYNAKLFTAVTHNRHDCEADVLRKMIDGNLSGIIAEGTKTGFLNPNHEAYKKIARKIPCIFLQSAPPMFKAPIMAVDAEKAGYMTVRYFLEMGHKKTGAILRADDMLSYRYYCGAINAMYDAGIVPSDKRVMWYHYEEFEDVFECAMNRIFFKYLYDCTAVACENSWVVKKLIGSLQRVGVKPFDDISILSLDDDDYAAENNISAMSYDRFELGARAARACLGIHKPSDRETVFLEPKIISRGSVHKGE